MAKPLDIDKELFKHLPPGIKALQRQARKELRLKKRKQFIDTNETRRNPDR
jgi:hypothetical protein